MAVRTHIDVLIHSSTDPNLQRFERGRSRWGHDGIFCTLEGDNDPHFREHVYRLEGPFRIYEIDDYDNGSFDILRGWTTDEEFLALLKEVGPAAGLPGDPPWPLPPGRYGIEYFRELDRLLREHIEALGGDGWLMGGEIVLWNYDQISKLTRLGTE
jgi:hypothetical protein